MRPSAILQRAALAARRRVVARIPYAVRHQVRRWLTPAESAPAVVETKKEVGSVAVVYLAREADGPEACERFLDSYRTFSAGTPHDLVVIFKGFKDRERTRALRNSLTGLHYREYTVEDRGFDLTPYFAVGKSLDYDYFFFLNTYSRILAPDWLEKILRHLLDPAVGLVGATASYESIGADFVRENESWKFWGPVARQRRTWLKFFAPFPNYSIRSNAFAISKRVLDRIRVPEIREKMDAYRLESGRNGMTQQVLRMGLNPVVVGRDGAAYLPADWWKSDTFRQASQANLLIADNQTEIFDKAAPDVREMLARLAWGDRARSKRV